METELVGSIKIKDGLFLGDQYAAQDLEFIVGNKVTYIINCAGNQVPNHWVPIGVKYLTYRWEDKKVQRLLDSSQKTISKVYSIIENTNSKGESVLIHSVHGKNRAVCTLCAYLMKKFQWTLAKTTEFLKTKKPEYKLRKAFVKQLLKFEKLLYSESALSSVWTTAKTQEELVLANTFLNSKLQEVTEVLPAAKPKKNLKWADDLTRTREPPYKISTQLKSCMKTSNNIEEGTADLKRESAKEENRLHALIRKIVKNPSVNSQSACSVNEKKIRPSSAMMGKKEPSLVEEAKILRIKQKRKTQPTMKKLPSPLTKKSAGRTLGIHSWNNPFK